MPIDRYRRLWVQMVSLLSTYLCMYDCSLRRLYCTQHVYKYLSLSLLVYYAVSRTALGATYDRLPALRYPRVMAPILA